MSMNDLDLFRQFGVGKAKKTDSGNTRCILYTRVSSKAQEDGMSLEVQAKTCRQFAERNGYEIVSEFGNRGESAKSGSVRKDFEEMLAFARKKVNQIRYIVFYDYSRFSREGGSAIVVKEELKSKYSHRAHFVRRVMERPKIMLLGTENDLAKLVGEQMARRT